MQSGGGELFATTAFTSTSCSVNIKAAPVDGDPGQQAVNLSQTNPTGCNFTGNTGGNPYWYYSVQASAVSGSISGGVTGTISTGQLFASTTSGLFGSTGEAGEATFDSSAQSQIQGEFSTSGPVRSGLLTFTSTLNVYDYNTDYIGTGSIDIIQNGQSTLVPGTCGYGGDTDPVEICSTQKVSILLGTSFSIEAIASVDQPSPVFDYANQSYTYFGEGGSFTIQDANGNAVESDLVSAPSSAAPEPSHLAALGFPLLLLAIAISRSRTRKSPVSSFSA